MYSPVSKYGPDARKRPPYRAAKAKSCGYYMRIVFFFSSLIQTLIIVSLVLFLIYGQRQDAASAGRVQELEMRFSQLSMETVSLRQQRRNLTRLLNVTVQDKTRNEWDLAYLKNSANVSYTLLMQMETKLQQCNFERMSRRGNCPPEIRTFNHFPSFQPVGGCNCGTEMETCKGKLELIQSNFTHTAMKMQMEMDQMSAERDRVNLEAIQLRREKFIHEKAIELYQIKCKDEFINSLSGISNVSKAFLNKIDSLFRTDPSFLLTCPKQEEYLMQIRTNCTNLSEDVVQKFQRYLDSLGEKVSKSTGNISVLTAENIRMTRDYHLCSQNRTALIREHRQHVDRVQLRNDEEKEKMLKEKLKLKGDIEVLQISVNYKNSELNHLKQQLQHLNMSCMPRTGGGLFPRPASQPGSTMGLNTGSSSLSNSGGLGQFNRNSFGSSSSSSSSNPQGSPYGSNGPNSGLGSTNTGFNKPSSPGLGTSSLGSNSGLGSSVLNKPGSSNQGSSSSLGSSLGSTSSGSSLNKQSSSSGLGSSLFGIPFGSSNPSSSSSNQNKFGGSSASSSSSSLGSSNSKSSSNLGSSSSNLGSSSSNLGSSSSNFGSSSSNLGSSSSNLGSSSSNLGSSSSNFGSSSSSSNNFGSSSSSLGSNFGSSSNSNLGSGSSSSSRTTSNSRGSTPFSSSSSSNSNQGSSSSSSQNKLSTTSSKSSPSSSSSSSGSSPSVSKGFDWWLLGTGTGSSSSSSSSSRSNSNSEQSKLGSNQGKGSTSSGTSFGSLGSGRSNMYAYTGPISYNEHIQDLRRIISTSVTEEKRDAFRTG